MTMKSVGQATRPKRPAPIEESKGEDIVYPMIERHSSEQANQQPQGVLQLLR
ncbi:hypothetical protein [Sporosarcina sp. P13]|uniref:hypothetical protein n=1 Tax=Sporosarcina sp. P13 TaxID=2048263 RepID=UPI001303FD19|nr:hypothetical protein [Sporosarcina sp. P13]